MKKVIITLLTLMITITMITLLRKSTYSIENTDSKLEGTREEFQDLVASTALSYYYNNEYSDYEQYSFVNGWTQEEPYYSSFGAENVNIFPESVNRNSYYPIACSAFTAMVYLNSIGYDMSEYYNLSPYVYYKNKNNDLERYNAYANIENYEEGILHYNSSWTTSFITRVGRKEYLKKYYGLALTDTQINTVVKNSTYAKTTGDINKILNTTVFSDTNTLLPDSYVNTNDNSIVMYYYKIPFQEKNNERIYSITSEEQEQIKTQMANILQKGDILVYRTIPKNASDNSLAGHAMLYVDDVLGENTKGFIHATGNDTLLPSNSNWPGYDNYAVRYSNIEYFNEFRFFNNNTKLYYEFTIVRPLNSICNNDSCTLDKNSITYDKYKDNFSKYTKNALARNELSKLRAEQYTYLNSLEKNISNYSSVNLNDNITYRLYLQNKTQYNICSSGTTTDEETCRNNGYTWMTVGTKDSINNLTITGKIPENTEFVSCNADCEQITENGKVVGVSWNYPKINYYVTLSYTVKVKKDNTTIRNEGMTVSTSTGASLQMGELLTRVNNTIEKSNAITMYTLIDKFEKLNKEEKIKYSNTNTGNYKINLDNISNTQMSSFDFIKNIYYNLLEVDLNYLTEDAIKGAIFNKINNYNIYTKKTDSQIASLTGNNATINKMLVKGVYGGKALKGNDGQDRISYLSRKYFDFGDIIICYLNGSYRYILVSRREELINDNWYDFIEFTTDGVIHYNDGNNGNNNYYKTLKEVLYLSDLFVVLRPSQVYNINWYINTLNKVKLDEDKSILNNILPGTNFNELINNIETLGNISLISNNGGSITNNDTAKTSDSISINYNNQVHKFNIAVLGDVTGDGKVLINDVAEVYSHVKGKITLEEEYFYSADVTHDNKILINDVAETYSYVKGKRDLELE